MTEPNKRDNIREELARADEALTAAELLYKNGLLRESVSRLYYYLLYMVRALLLTKGLEPRSHEGALRLFSLHFVKTKIFDPGDAHTLSKLMKYREEADYNPSYSFAKKDFAEFLKEARRVAGKVTAHLAEKRYL